jgi:xylulokinase
MKPLFVGVDLGTSSVKVGLFDPSGHVVHLVRASYPLYAPQPGWAEQDPNDWWLAVTSALEQILSDVDPADVAAVGLSGQCPGHVLIAGDGTPLGRAIIWSDQRAVVEASWLAEHMSRDQAREWVGCDSVADVTQTPTRLLWIQRHQPDQWRLAQAVLQPKDFVGRLLTGQCATDHNSAYGMVNSESRLYHPQYLEFLGVDEQRLPAVLAPTDITGHVTPEAAAATHLVAGTPVVTGTIDAWCDIIGCGGTTPGQAVDAAGTSEIVALIDRRPDGGCQSDVGTAQGVFATRLLDDLCWIGGPMYAGGGTLLWWQQCFCQGSDLDNLATEAADPEPRPDDPLFLPYLRGERAPVWDIKARGAFIGLAPHHNRGHCTRAVYEGLAFAVRDILQRCQNATGIKAASLRVSGGSSRSAVWNQIKADVTGLRVQPMLVSDAGCLGAAMLAALGTKSFSDVGHAARAMVHPATEYQPRLHYEAVHNVRFDIWRKIYPALKPLFS